MNGMQLTGLRANGGCSNYLRNHLLLRHLRRETDSGRCLSHRPRHPVHPNLAQARREGGAQLPTTARKERRPNGGSGWAVGVEGADWALCCCTVMASDKTSGAVVADGVAAAVVVVSADVDTY